MTHEAQLSCSPDLLRSFLADVAHLGNKLGPILFQLPPKAAFDPEVAERFFSLYRDLHQGPTVFEPRHPSWFTPAAQQLLENFRVARVAADPPVASCPAASDSRTGLAYYRLHGTPRVYYSDYSVEELERLADQITEQRKRVEVWCIFDNTALGHAFGNALWLQNRLAVR